MAWARLILVAATFLQFASCQRDTSYYPQSCQFEQETTKGAMPSMNTANVEFESQLAPGWDDFSWTTEFKCILQAVIKVTPPPSASAIKISFNMFNPQWYSFHVADTSTNDGEGGDSGTGGGYNAEIYAANSTLHVYKRTLNRSGPPPHTFVKFFLNGQQVFLNLRITRDNKINFDSKGRSRGYKLDMENEDMFNFDEMYIGLNRLVGNATKIGLGICGICVDFDY